MRDWSVEGAESTSKSFKPEAREILHERIAQDMCYVCILVTEHQTGLSSTNPQPAH